MRPLAETLRDARTAAKLSEAIMARLLGVEPAELKRLETGQTEVTPSVLDRCAQLFGLRLKHFMAGEAGKTPMALLFRSMYEAGRPALADLADTDAHHAARCRACRTSPRLRRRRE
jgi:transcriptional regulator with XRE-family HTH domain